ncbi:hypothetical protein M3Y99_01885200 [Aphelenchoides fujianensis]|nr:hypothetical protein M3Y99_01885200 [Aphelenchoides fujianensis]
MDASSSLDALFESEKETQQIHSEEDDAKAPAERRPRTTHTYEVLQNFDDKATFDEWAEENIGDWKSNRKYVRKLNGEDAIKPSLFSEARQLRLKNGPIYEPKYVNDPFVMPSSAFSDVKPGAVKVARREVDAVEFDSFHDYESARFRVHLLVLKNGRFVCSCPVGSKKHCKHSVRLAVQQGHFEWPPDARATTIGQKPKRGRPKNAATQRSQVGRKHSQDTSQTRAASSRSQTVDTDEPPRKKTRTRKERSRSKSRH